MSEFDELLLDWSQIDEFSFEPSEAEKDSSPVSVDTAPPSPSPAMEVPLPAIVLSTLEEAPPKKQRPPSLKRKRVEGGPQKKQPPPLLKRRLVSGPPKKKRKAPEQKPCPVVEIFSKDRIALVERLIKWFRDCCGYEKRSQSSPYDDVKQLGYESEVFHEKKESKVWVAVLQRKFPMPVGTYRVRIFDRPGRFPVVFVSCANGVVAELQRVESVEYLEANVHLLLPQFDVETDEVHTPYGTVGLGPLPPEDPL